MEEPSFVNRRVMELTSLEATSRSASREDSDCGRRPKEADHPSGQHRATTTTEADLASTIQWLLPHLQSMVSLLAQTVTPSVEGKMMEKRGRVALDQAASMMVAVSHPSFTKIALPF